ncbi:MAG: hypothetical protein COA94_09070 [Rickettsiales bacterium]|nr:MAG: hypothetical protein COA94_09070 [Rickettsiales bacterium]
MICKSPRSYSLPPTGQIPFSLPFGVAFNEDEFRPWTHSGHMYRFYDQPRLSKAVPYEVNLNEVSEVYVYAARKSIFY